MTPLNLIQNLYSSKLNHSKWQPDPLFWIMFALIIIFSLGIMVSMVRAEEIDLSIIATIESSNNPFAYNRNSQAIGLFQITPICLSDYNLCHKTLYELTDLLSPKFNYLVAYWYLTKRIPQMLRAHKIPVTIENILWSYNAGVGRVKQGIKPKETQRYLKLYKKYANRNLSKK